jgi:uncharacterized protein (TIGR02145 family)
MKRKTKPQPIPILILLMTICVGAVFGQSYHLGDLYTFRDGSQGIVIYVDPLDACRGTVAALNDLDEPYALWSNTIPESVKSVPVPSFSHSRTTSWSNVGSIITQALNASGESPAAGAMDIANGWYIPDIVQLRRIFGLITTLQDNFEKADGNLLVMTQRSYWSSSRTVSSAYYMSSTGEITLNFGNNAKYIRPVRDFGNDTTLAFWADNPPKTDTVVSPATTTSYDALVIYGTDTLVYTSTVTVHPAYSGDTLYETAFVSPQPYTSTVNPIFDQLDISEPGEHIFRKGLQTVHGCDSAATLILTVNDQKHYSETLCPLSEDYYYAPFDTIFQPGTVSGMYVHHGSKVVDGVSVDTTAYLNLTILPSYKSYDTLLWCHDNIEESIPYHPNENVIISIQDSTVSVVSLSDEIVIKEEVANIDYVLMMQTIDGCDSLIFLHLDIHKVTKDTVLYEVPITHIIDNQIFVVCHLFEDITEPGTYTAQEYFSDIYGCDSIVTVILIVNPCTVDFSISCPPDIIDTLAYGDCVMTIYPERFGTPMIICDQEWPFLVSNNIPTELLFSEGEHLITWTVTDSICGLMDSCQQRVVIAFPQCPDAVDCEGNIYHGVRIGCDCWTQRNLESTKYSDCTDIPDVYEYATHLHPDTAENVAIFGRLYTFEASVRDSADNGHGHIQGICPDGWYLPTPEKYAKLNTYDATALKSPLYWVDGGGNNSTGFSALPAGYYNGEKNRFEGLYSETYFWSTQKVNSATGESLFLIRHHCDYVLEVLTYSGLGYSIRCIKER